MSEWLARLRLLPLRTKVVITLVGGGLALLGGATHLSFRYWQEEALVIAERQALLGASAVRASVETGLRAGRTGQLRSRLRDLGERGHIGRARVYAPDGRILLSSDPAEDGRRDHLGWLPPHAAFPAEGLVRHEPGEGAVHAVLPLSAPGAAYLEVSFPSGPLRSAIDRGLWLGLLLVGASGVAMVALLFAMLQREVVEPVRRVAVRLGAGPAPEPRRRDEIRALAASVEELIEKERAAGALAQEQRRQIEAQAGLAQVGEMAAEMAHEFKRPLASIRTALELMLMGQEYTLDASGEHLLLSVQGQLDKLGETMRDLFSLARPVEFEREAVDLREVLDGALLQLAGHPATDRVEIRREYGAARPVCGDPQRLEQVALNLLLNAAEAMPSGGRITVRLGGTTQRVFFEVEDTGVGIAPDALEKVQRPFYSTKPTGTGLGLALVARVVAAHEGALALDSEPGRGTRARVELPAQAHPGTPATREGAWLTLAS